MAIMSKKQIIFIKTTKIDKVRGIERQKKGKPAATYNTLLP